MRALIIAAAVVSSGADLVALSVGAHVMNALLLPVVLGFVFLLARKLPKLHRLDGVYAWVSGILITATVIFGVFSAVSGLWG